MLNVKVCTWWIHQVLSGIPTLSILKTFWWCQWNIRSDISGLLKIDANIQEWQSFRFRPLRFKEWSRWHMPEGRLMWQTQRCASPFSYSKGMRWQVYVTTHDANMKHTKKHRPEEDMVIHHSQTWHTYLNETNGDHSLEWIPETQVILFCSVTAVGIYKSSSETTGCCSYIPILVYTVKVKFLV
jgi:hypothetical protein